MEFAKILQSGVLISKNPFAGAKPLTRNAVENRDGYRAVSSFVNNGDTVEELWNYIELTEEEKREEAKEAPISEDEALVRFSNELTGAEDETLTDATETLIKKLKEDN